MPDGLRGAHTSVFAVVVLLLTVAAPTTAGQWYRLCPTQTQGDFLRDVRFADSLRGWMVGRCSVFATSDRGRTWSVDYMVSSDTDTTRGVFGLAVVDTDHVYMSDYRNYAGQGHVPPPISDVYVRSRRRSGSWRQLVHLYFEGRSEFVTARRLFFFDTLHGWHVGRSLSHDDASRTADGGKTWQSYQRIMGVGDADAWFVDSLVGWVAGDVVRRTSDAGASWQNQLPFGTKATRVRMLDSLRGWVLASAGIFRTSDGGDSWAQVLTQDSFVTMWFCDSMHGACGGSRGRILRTTDGGTTWLTDTTGVTWNVRSVFMLDSTHAWAVGDSGVVLGYSDWAMPGLEEQHQRRTAALALDGAWPNPCRGTLWLGLRGGTDPVVVYDYSGRPVRRVQYASSRAEKIDLRGLPVGVYFVRIPSSPRAGVRFVLLR
jgi:photosystem II stability/assembly factor-like uncharacterized protein